MFVGCGVKGKTYGVMLQEGTSAGDGGEERLRRDMLSRCKTMTKGLAVRSCVALATS